MKLADILAFCHRTTTPLIIARTSEGPTGYQVRFSPDRDPRLKTREPKGIRIEGRRWLDQSAQGITSSRGTLAGYVGWAHWSTFIGWGFESVIATDWEFVKEGV